MSGHSAAGTHAEATKHADTGVHKTQKSFKSDRRDKASHSGKLGATSGPKKGGGGGKGTWGRPGDEAREDEMDPNDPNYASDEEVAPVRGYNWEPESASSIKFASSLSDLTKFKAAIKSAAREYLQSNDANEFSHVVKNLSMTVFHSDLPSILIKFSFDVTDAERVRISGLLLALHKAGLITHFQMGAGVRKLYNHLSELQIDCPNARTLLREHVQFATVGGFLDAALAKQLEAEQDALSDAGKVAELKGKIKQIVNEFYRSEDLPDAVKSLTELNAPFLAFETVKQLVSQALDRGNRQREGASVFLADQSGAYLSAESIEKGFTLILERVDDLALDVPDILKFLSIFVARAVVDEVLPPAFLVRQDLTSNDAGSRVLQQAQHLLKQEEASDRLLYAWEDLDAEAEKKKSGGAGAGAASAAQ